MSKKNGKITMRLVNTLVGEKTEYPDTSGLSLREQGLLDALNLIQEGQRMVADGRRQEEEGRKALDLIIAGAKMRGTTDAVPRVLRVKKTSSGVDKWGARTATPAMLERVMKAVSALETPYFQNIMKAVKTDYYSVKRALEALVNDGKVVPDTVTKFGRSLKIWKPAT